MQLVINMTVAEAHIRYAYSPQKKLLCYYVACIQINSNILSSFVIFI